MGRTEKYQQNRKIPTDFYLVAIWQHNPVKG